MKTVYIKRIHECISKLFCLVAFVLFLTSGLKAQTTLTTLPNPPYNGSNGAGTNFAVTFVVENTNAFPILLNNVGAWLNTTDVNGTYQLWYSSTSLSGTPTPITTPNWTQISQVTNFPAPAVSGITPVFNSLGFTIPAGTQYRFAFYYVTVASHYSGSGVGTVTPSTFNGGGVNFKLGDVQIAGQFVGYGGPNNPRWFTGSISFEPAGPCTDPPTAGTVISNLPNPICASNPFTLSISGGTGGIGQSYQWESSPNGINSWTNIIGATNASLSSSTTSTTFYRCNVTCGATVTTLPYQVVISPALPGGTYTINSSVATGGSNFQSFTDAVNALNCGIAGPVIFNVSNAVYNEQITIPQLLGSSSTNTVTFNGNNATLQFSGILGAPHTLLLNGADYISFNNLNVIGTGTTYALVVHLWNQADNNNFTNCTFTAPANGTSTTQVPFSISGSATSATTSGVSGNNNIVTGCTINSGYYNTCFVGNSIVSNTGNQLINCNLLDFYFYGSYNLYQDGMIIRGNTIERPLRTTLSTFYGIYVVTGCINTLVEKNRIRNPFGAAPTNTSLAYGIYCSIDGAPGQENKFYNNLITNFNSNGQVYGMYMLGADFFNAYHNTIAIDHAASTYTGITYGIYSSGSTGGMNIRNNNITIRRGGTGAKYGLYYLNNVGRISNNNNIYMFSTAGTQFVGFYVTGFITLANWKTANAASWDQQSQSADPVYVNVAVENYQPSNSIINNIGANVGITTDITNAARTVATPDPGAYEFSVGGLDASISWIAPLSPTTTGLKTVIVNITNTQTVIINSINITYTNGVTPVTQNFTGLNILPGTNTNLSFTTQFNVTSGVILTATINTVNNVVDNLAANNTVSYNLCVGLSGVYTINAGAPASATNFQSFTTAVTALTCGIAGPVTFNVVSLSGPYTEQISIPQVNGVSAVNTITFNGNGNTLTFNATLFTDPHTLVLNGADFISFNNLNFVGTGPTYALVVHLWNQADNNSFTNCTFTAPANGTSTTQVPFSISGSATSGTTSGVSGSNNTITGCTMNNGYYNTCIVGNSALLSTGNQLIDCNLLDYYFYGSYNLYQNGAVIRGNTIKRPTRNVLSTFYGIYVSTGCTNMLVERNRISNLFDATPTSTSTAYGIYCNVDGTLGNENKFYNNLIYGMNGNGLHYGIYLLGSDFVRAYHNTISHDYTSATAGTTYGIYSSGTVGGIDIRNNNITISRGGTGTKYGIYFTSSIGRTCNNNNIFMSSADGINNTGFFSVDYLTLANWQTANGNSWDQNSVAVDPNYDDPANGNYLPYNVALNNIGANVGIATDIEGNSRLLATPDPGAYEMQLHPVNLGATALINPVAGDCHTSIQTVTIQVKNYGINVLNFATTPATVTTNITGAISTSLSATISSGTLAVGAVMNVTMSAPFNMSANGNYTFNSFTTIAGDGQVANDDMNPVTITKIFSGGSIVIPTTDHCISNPPQTLTSSGSAGANIQWQSSINSAGGPWTNVGSGLESFTPASMLQNTFYRAVYSCDVNTVTSNVLTVIVNNPVINNTTAGSRCGAGTVNLGASANAGINLDWYGAPTGGNLLGSGSSFTTPLITAPTNFYVEAKTAGGSGGTPIAITEVDLGGNDQLEIMNVSPNAVNVTGWKVAVSDDYTNINAVNTIIQTLSGTMNPGDIKTWTDLASATNYWGSNLFWNPGAFPSFTGWVVIIDNTGNIVDFVAWAWPASNIAAMNPVVAGFPLTIGTKWSGNGINASVVAATQSLSRQGNQDNDDNTDFAINNLSIGVINPGMTTPFIGFGCASLRQAVLANVTPSIPISAVTSDAIVCAGNPSDVSVSSSNPNYSYSWTSNPAGFFGSGVGPLNVNPSATTTYSVYAFDASTQCGALDNVQITATPNNLVALASATPSTVCFGEDVQLNSNVVSSAPASNYLFSASAGSFSPLAIGVPVTAIQTDDASSGLLPIGFTFYYEGVAYNNLYASSNGILTLGGANAALGNDIATGTGRPIIAPLWDDLQGANGTAAYYTSGSVGSRVFTFQWLNWRWYYTVASPTISFQVKLYEANGRIDFIYRQEPASLNGINESASIGIGGALSGNYLSLDNSSSSPTASSVTETTTISLKPATGQVYTFQPPSGNYSYAWSPAGSFSNSAISNPIINDIASSGPYTVVATEINSGCTASQTASIILNPLPVPAASSNTPVCDGQDLYFTSNSGNVNYTWSGPIGYGSTLEDPVLSGAVLAATGSYTLTVTDNNGCVGTETIDVTVNANPVMGLVITPVSCQGFSDGGVEVTVNGGDQNGFYFISDEIGNFGFTNPQVFSGYSAGSYPYLVQDGNSCFTNDTIIIGTVPNVGPAISCVSNISIDTDPGSCGAVVTYATPVGTDACPDATTAQIAGLASGTLYPVGVTTNTFVVTDVLGLTASCSFTVTVTDNEAPAANCNNLTVQLNSAGTGAITVAQVDNGSSDACGVQSVTASPTSFTCANVGANTVILTVTDNNGNVSTCSSIVTVEDNVAPVALCQNLTVQLSAAGTASITTSQIDNGSSDACGIQSLTLSQSSFTCSNVGANTVILTVTDNNGNVSTCSSVVTVQDNVLPVALCQNLTVQLSAAGTASLTAAQVDNGSSDACGIQSLAISQSNFSCANVGANTVILTVTDNNGNVSTCSSIVTVQDNVAPVALCQNLTIQLSAAGTASITTSQIDNGSSDACGIQSIAISQSSFTCANVGANTVILTVTDNNGNVSTCSSTVTVEDNVAPVALCQNVTVQLSASGTASITASQVDNGSSDACGIQSITVSPNSFTCANLGANTVTLTVTDNNGNVSTCTSTVTVQDNTTPLISCTSNISVVNNPGICGAVITYAAPVASDNCSYTVTLTAGLASGSTFPIGTTVNTFVVTDAAGNTASCSFNVTVTDNQAPAIANCPVNFATCNPVTWTPPTVTDNCPGVQVVSSHTPGTIFPVGNTTVTYTATDVYNNVSTCSFVVTVQTPSIAADSITSNREYNNICLGENITLSVNGGVLGFQAQWKWYRGGCGTAGGGVLVASNVTSITVAPTTTTTYYVRAEGTCNNTACQQMTVTVSAGAPTANINYLTVPAFGAPGVTSTITVNTIPGATYYRWTTNNGQINGVLFNGQLGPVQTTVPTVQITFVLPQSNYQLRVTAGNACGRTNQANNHIRGTVPAPTSLTGPTQVCPGQTATYTVSAVPSAGSYIWALIPSSAGTISGSGLTRTVTFAAGFTSAQLCVNGVSNFGLSGAPLCISISTSAPSPVAVSGNPNPCQGSTGTYTTAAVTGATSYIWTTTVPGATISGTTTSASVVFPTGAFTGTICVRSVSSCGTSAPTCMTVTSGAPGVPGPITGPVQGICNASNVNYAIAASAGAISYNWVMPAGASIASGGTSNSVNVNFLPGFTSGTITVNVTYACGTASSTLSINGAPSVPVVNPATICPGTDELYFASAVGATSFNWTVTGQTYAECTNPPSCSQYYVIWGATGGSFSVTASNTCGTSAPLVISTNCRISESTELDSRVYPNPTSGMVTVEFTSASESNYTIRVTDLTGRELMVETVKSVQGLNQHEVNLTSFNKGIYMLHLNDAKGNTKVSRVAVQ